MSTLISLDQLKEGMILDASAKNKYGQVLLAEGASLQPQHKRLLSMWGVTMVLIRDSDEIKRELQLDDTVLGQITTTLEKRINWQPENAFEKDLFNMAVKSKLKSLTRAEE